MDPEDVLPLFVALTPVIQSVLHRISHWRTPTNWSLSDWASEEHAVVNQSAFQTITEYRGKPEASLARVVYFRALARALTRYRQEWLYSSRFVPFTGCDESEDTEEPPRNTAIQELTTTQKEQTTEWLTSALESLPEPDHLLIQQLFWYERTQADLARDLHISQRSVSKRKQRALETIRIALQQQGLLSAPLLGRPCKKISRKNILTKMHTEVLKSESQSNI